MSKKAKGKSTAKVRRKKTTQTDIAKQLGVSQPAISQQYKALKAELAADGVKITSDEKLNKLLMARAVSAPLRDSSQQRNSVKDAKTAMEVRILDLKYKKLTGELIDRDTYAQGLTILAEIYQSAFTEFRQWVGVIYPQADAKKKLTDLENSARRRIKVLIDEAIKGAV